MGAVTDGASDMMKFGRNTSPLHIVCLAPAIHLFICDELHKKRTGNELIEKDDISRVKEEEEESDQLDEDDIAKDNLVLYEVLVTVLALDFHAIVEKVRKYSKAIPKVVCVQLHQSAASKHCFLWKRKSSFNGLQNAVK